MVRGLQLEPGAMFHEVQWDRWRATAPRQSSLLAFASRHRRGAAAHADPEVCTGISLEMHMGVHLWLTSTLALPLTYVQSPGSTSL